MPRRSSRRARLVWEAFWRGNRWFVVVVLDSLSFQIPFSRGSLQLYVIGVRLRVEVSSRASLFFGGTERLVQSFVFLFTWFWKAYNEAQRSPLLVNVL